MVDSDLDSSIDQFEEIMLAAAQGFGAPEKTIARVGAERRANRTIKERARRSRKTASLTCRCTETTRELAEAMQDKLDCSLGEVIELAIALLARKEKV